MNNARSQFFMFLGFLTGNGISQCFLADSLAEGVFKTLVISIITSLLMSVFYYFIDRAEAEKREQLKQKLQEITSPEQVVNTEKEQPKNLKDML